MAVNQPALYPATPALGRPREVDLVVFSVTALALAGVTLGVLASLAGAAKALRTTPVAAAFAFVLMAVLIPAGCLYSFRSAKRLPDSAFIGLIASLWLVSRWIVVFAFPGYVPTGDEENLHRFVVALSTGGRGARDL